MQKKIILACSIINYGGVGKILNFVASSLLDDGWEVTALSLRSEERPSFLSSKASYFTLEKSRFKNSLLWRSEEILHLRRVLKNKRPSIICTFGSEPSVMVRLATLGLRNITVVSAERSDPYTSDILWKTLTSWAYKNSDYCVFQLEKQRDFYGKKVREKSFVIPNPFIPKNDNPIISNRRKTIVSAGRFVYQKGYDTLIKAFAKVYQRHPDYTLELYGGGQDKSLYEGIIKDLNLEDCVKLYDYAEDVTSIIIDCSVFVLSSRFEGIPNVLIEAMSVGVPTVSTDCTPGGPAFLTENGKRGLLVDVDDIEALSSSICKIIESTELSNLLSETGKEICVILEEKHIAQQWIQMFSKILE